LCDQFLPGLPDGKRAVSSKDLKEFETLRGRVCTILLRSSVSIVASDRARVIACCMCNECTALMHRGQWAPALVKLIEKGLSPAAGDASDVLSLKAMLKEIDEWRAPVVELPMEQQLASMPVATAEFLLQVALPNKVR